MATAQGGAHPGTTGRHLLVACLCAAFLLYAVHLSLNRIADRNSSVPNCDSGRDSRDQAFSEAGAASQAIGMGSSSSQSHSLSEADQSEWSELQRRFSLMNPGPGDGLPAASGEGSVTDSAQGKVQGNLPRLLLSPRQAVLPMDLVEFPPCPNPIVFGMKTDGIRSDQIESGLTGSSSSPSAAAVRRLVLDLIYDGVSPFDGFPDESFSRLLPRKIRSRGWGSDAPVFARLVREVRPAVVIELGTFLGASAMTMARAARDVGLNDTLVLCVDDFRGWPGFRKKKIFSKIRDVNGDVMLLQAFMRNVVAAGLHDIILPVPFSTAHAMAAFCNMGIRADLIEVDAGHDFHSAWADLNLAHRLLRPGGVMFGHDYATKADRSGVRRAVTLFAGMRGLSVEQDGEHWIFRPGKISDEAPQKPA